MSSFIAFWYCQVGLDYVNPLEFHLSQTYHEGLLKLQAKEYAKARELLEAVLRDPLISSAQVESSTSDGHMLQLRFLTLKNLANVFLQQGPSHYESALHCYLQAVEIDAKDSVVWNQLGTLSCSMGLLSISRWAFEQGLFCSPNNWNCMEKLLEVLIAIRDEVACLSVAELILRHWPSHSRALHVKNTIQESESIPFAPKGIDKLEPKHVRLKFPDKRKATDENINEGVALKRPCKNIELNLLEACWTSLADAILGVILPMTEKNNNYNKKLERCSDTRLSINLPPSSEIVSGSAEGESMSLRERTPEKANLFKEKEACTDEEQHPQERRSTRLERLRNRKPGKEEMDFSTSRDLAKVVVQFLEPFVVGRLETMESDHARSGLSNSSDTEHNEVMKFVTEASKNYGAYHMGHLLLEEVASRMPPYQEVFVKFLELEKLTRHWDQDRTIECSLFLAELYYDLGLCSSSESKPSDFLSDASYNLCKVIEMVALDSSVDWSGVLNTDNNSRMDTYTNDLDKSSAKSGCMSGNEKGLSNNTLQDTGLVAAGDSDFRKPLLDNAILPSKSSFWIRFFWLSGHLSILAGEKEKAYEEFCISLSLLRNGPLGSVPLPHCKLTRELTVERVLHEIHLLKLDSLLKKTVTEMIEKEMYTECVNLLAPLLLSSRDVYLDFLPDAYKEGEKVTSVELSALDILIMACEKATPMNVEIYLNSHRRKLHVLTVAAGMAEYTATHRTFHKKAIPKSRSASELELVESTCKQWSHLVAEEVKAISRCASQVKNFIDQCGSSDVVSVPASIIGDIQALLLTVMCNTISIFLCKKYSGLGTVDQTEQPESDCFVDATITFCKLQHLNQSVPVKTQVELIVAIHELLAEYGLCCAGKDSEGEEGTFLKLAIKHLLALDMKLKSSFQSSNKGLEATLCQELLTHSNHLKSSASESNANTPAVMETSVAGEDKTVSVKKEPVELEDMTCEGISSRGSSGKDDEGVEHGKIDLDGKNEDHLVDIEREKIELGIENALDQSFFCLYGLDLRSPDSLSEDDLAIHKNTSRGDYQTKEQCADVFHYLLPYAKASSRAGLMKVRRVLRAIRKHFPQPPEDMLCENSLSNFLDNPDLCEEKLSEEAGTDGFLEYIMKLIFPNGRSLKQCNTLTVGSSEPYAEVYGNLYYFLAQAEEMSATDKWAGFVLTKEGEEFVEQNTNLFKYDLLYNPLRFESWQRLANIYDEEVDLLLNDGSKQLNVVGWRKNPTLPQRVETSRRRSRRCLLMSLALAKTPVQQSEIHELLALVYYDGIQNVVPIYDQRSVVPTKDAAWITFCQNSMKHFEKAFSHKPEWSHAFYLGKLCEKLGYPYEKAFSFYDKAITFNPSAVDPFYRMHASRMKLLYTCGKHNLEALKVVAAYSFNQSTKETIINIIDRTGSDSPQLAADLKENINGENSEGKKHVDHLDEAWHMLYNDCLSAIEVCVDGELKHFHKARYTLAQGWYRRGESGDLERAKDELSFCFKSSRSSFTINMWEIDGMVRKGRSKKPGLTGNKKSLEVNLPESSRKFITCIRKYTLFYLKLLQESGDISTLERAYVSLRADKRFCLCLEDLVPVALGRYIQALVSSIRQAETPGSADVSSSPEHLLEKMFNLFMDHGNLWTDISSLPEIKSPELPESSFYGYLHQYIQSLERDVKLDALEGINEKIRKRFKNPKLSNSNCAKVCRHASVAWYRSIVISLVLITSSRSEASSGAQVPNSVAPVSENRPLLCVDLQENELWTSSFEDPTHLKSFEAKWSHDLSKIKGIVIKQVSEEYMDTANMLLRSSYNFYKESSCGTLPSGINLYTVLSSLLAPDAPFKPGTDGVDIIDLSIPRKLLLWAYTLVHGRYSNILAVVKHCEENAKSKMKKGGGTSSIPSHTNTPTSAATHSGGGGKERVAHDGCGETEENPLPMVASTSLPEADGARCSNVLSSPTETQKTSFSAPQLQQCNNGATEKSISDVNEGGENSQELCTESDVTYLNVYHLIVEAKARSLIDRGIAVMNVSTSKFAEDYYRWENLLTKYLQMLVGATFKIAFGVKASERGSEQECKHEVPEWERNPIRRFWLLILMARPTGLNSTESSFLLLVVTFFKIWTAGEEFTAAGRRRKGRRSEVGRPPESRSPERRLPVAGVEVAGRRSDEVDR
ncbi:Tetratricopeptide repeat-containing domain [Macleaya cordata]|uniref:Tetratricopeptide repeat-containing domain n=1 Tax=Macleaya cordata TaxID=56857 RepID=A0A200QVF1_MACCD|nr:Tetratricopeptide repeat-containing domain [Macleaya cordata]